MQTLISTNILIKPILIITAPYENYNAFLTQSHHAHILQTEQLDGPRNV